MERYVYSQDTDSDQIFSDNTPFNFKTQLNSPLNFEGYWKVALTEISLQMDSKKHLKTSDNTFFILTFVKRVLMQVVNMQFLDE